MSIELNGTTGITTPDLTSTDDITANSSAVLTSASLPTALNATGSAPIYAARAWVNFNGTGDVAIRAAGNVSSITDVDTGTYEVNFTTAIPDENYAATVTTGLSELGGINALFTLLPSTNSFRVYTYAVAGGGAGAYRDTADISAVVHR